MSVNSSYVLLSLIGHDVCTEIKKFEFEPISESRKMFNYQLGIHLDKCYHDYHKHSIESVAKLEKHKTKYDFVTQCEIQEEIFDIYNNLQQIGDYDLMKKYPKIKLQEQHEKHDL